MEAKKEMLAKLDSRVMSDVIQQSDVGSVSRKCYYLGSTEQNLSFRYRLSSAKIEHVIWYFL